MVAKRQQQHGAPIATYTYQNEDGTPAYRVLRYESKNFSQQHYDGGQWISGLGNQKPLPYHLPRILKSLAAQPERPIFIVEGEKDADNATEQLSLVATCNNGGAGHWQAVQSAYLSGAHVVIVPDNDAAGRNHAAIAAQYLHDAHAASIRVIVLPDMFGGQQVKDISDFIAAGGTHADLVRLYQAAPSYQPSDLDSWLKKPNATTQRTISENAPRHIEGDNARYTAYARRALENVTSELAGTPEGRFDAMKAAANRLGAIAAHGLLTETECMTALISACATNGYEAKCGQRTTENRLRCYFRSGLAHPCELPTAPTLPIKLPKTSEGKQPLAINPHLLDYGLPDRLCAAVRRCFHQTIAPTLYLWLIAIAAGLFAASASVDAVQLADAAEKLGYADPEERVKTRHLYRTGLEKAAERGLVLANRVEKRDTVLPITGKDSIDDSLNTVSHFSTTYQLPSAETIVTIVRQWLPIVVKETHYPTADKPRKNRQGETWLFEAATLAHPEPDWIDQDAEQTIQDIMAQGELHLDREAAERIVKAERATNSDYAYFSKIGSDATMTPLPTGWKFHSAREFIALRWRGIEQATQGKPRSQWQIAQMLGVARSRLPDFRNKAGLKAEAQIVPVKVTTAAQAIEAAAQARGHLRTIEITAADGTAHRMPYDVPTAERVIAAACARGEDVMVHIQSASKQQIVTDVQPKPVPRRAPVIALAPAQEAEPVSRTTVIWPTTAPEIEHVSPSLPPVTTAPEVASLDVSSTVLPDVASFSRDWVRGQLVLQMKARGFTERGDSIVNPDGVIVAYTAFANLTYNTVIHVARGRSLIDDGTNNTRECDKSDLKICSMDRARLLCEGVSQAEREARMAGREKGLGTTEFLAQLSSAELVGMARYQRDDEIW